MPSNLETAKKAYDLFLRGDVQTMLTEHVADTARYVISGIKEKMPWIGAYQGKQQVADFFQNSGPACRVHWLKVGTSRTAYAAAMAASARLYRLPVTEANVGNRRSAEAGDLVSELPLTARERPLPLRTFDGKVCPIPLKKYGVAGAGLR